MANWAAPMPETFRDDRNESEADTMPKRFRIAPGRLFINGEWRFAAAGSTLSTVNPATEEEITVFADAGDADAAMAAAAAHFAFERGPWPRMTGAERGQVLAKVGDLIMRNADELAYRQTVDSGRPLRYSRENDIPLIAGLFHRHAEWAAQIQGAIRPTPGLQANSFNYTLREPLGAVAVVASVDVPRSLSITRVVSALACGNTVVHKPASGTPLAAIMLAELLAEAGVPDGAYNLLTGLTSKIAPALAANRYLRRIILIGDTRRIQEIMAAPLDPERMMVEHHSRPPAIVLADADLEKLAESLVAATCRDNGEARVTGCRLIVEKLAYRQLLDAIKKRKSEIVVGDPLDPSTTCGPVSTRAEFQRALEFFSQAKTDDVTVKLGGKRHDIGTGKGYFLAPTVLAVEDPSSPIAKEEISGPVLTMIPAADFDACIDIAHQINAEPSIAVHTRDIRNAHKAARSLKVASVLINNQESPQTRPRLTPAGYPESFESYLQTKSVWMDLE